MGSHQLTPNVASRNYATLLHDPNNRRLLWSARARTPGTGLNSNAVHFMRRNTIHLGEPDKQAGQMAQFRIP